MFFTVKICRMCQGYSEIIFQNNFAGLRYITYQTTYSAEVSKILLCPLEPTSHLSIGTRETECNDNIKSTCDVKLNYYCDFDQILLEACQAARERARNIQELYLYLLSFFIYILEIQRSV